MKPTAEYIRSRVTYDPALGDVRWVKCRKSTQIGQIAGMTDGRRRKIVFDGRGYPLSHVIWVWMTGTWPTNLIDHKNLDGMDNRWCNLREADKSQNAQNTGIRKDNISGFKGVGWDDGRQKWRADIRIPKGPMKHLGMFDDPADGGRAYALASQKYHGDYGRLS